MTTYSVFNGATPPGTQVNTTDAGKLIEVGNAFNLTANLSGWTCTGGRIYLDPSLAAGVESPIHASIRTSNDFSTTALQTKAVTVNGTGGWYSWTWDTPVAMPADQSPVWISYTVGATGTHFLSSGTTGVTTSAIVSTMTGQLQMPAAAAPRSRFKETTMGTSAQGVLYGLDILVSDPGSMSPISFTATKVSGTAVDVAWTDPGDAAHGFTIARAAGDQTATNDGAGNAPGAAGYDPTTIAGVAIIATGQTSAPYHDTGLTPGTYTYWVARTGS